MQTYTTKLNIFLLALGIFSLPACKQVPRLKTLPSIIKQSNQLTGSSNYVHGYAQACTKQEIRPYIGFTPRTRELGIPWIITIENDSQLPYRYYSDSFGTYRFQPEIIHDRFIQAYNNHALGLIPAWCVVGGVIMPLSLFVLAMGTAQATMTLGAYAFVGGVLTVAFGPVIALKLYENSNNNAYEFSVKQLEENLFPKQGLIEPQSSLTGIVFLPESSLDGWSLELENSVHDTTVLLSLKK